MAAGALICFAMVLPRGMRIVFACVDNAGGWGLQYPRILSLWGFTIRKFKTSQVVARATGHVLVLMSHLSES